MSYNLSMKEVQKTIAERREEFLTDMLEYYSVDPIARRCKNSAGKCVYSPISPGSEGCAIGRHLPERLSAELDDKYRVSNNSVCNVEIFRQLPKWMQELGMNFLGDMQALHDDDQSWPLTEPVTEPEEIKLKLPAAASLKRNQRVADIRNCWIESDSAQNA
jgi:hypothetical protein